MAKHKLSFHGRSKNGTNCPTIGQSAKQANKARMAIRHIIFFLECAFVELSLAVRTNEVLWVVLAIHCSDTSAGDRLVASSTHRTALSMEMCLAIWHPIVLKECSSAKRNVAFLKKNNVRHYCTKTVENIKFPMCLSISESS